MLREVQAMFATKELARTEFQDKYGFARPPMATKMGDKWFIAIGGSIYKQTREGGYNFVDALHDHALEFFGEPFIGAEQAKPFECRHPAIQWLETAVAIDEQRCKETTGLRGYRPRRQPAPNDWTNAIKAAIASTTNVAVKGQIAAAAQLAASLPGRAMTIAKFCESFNFSPETTQAILSKVTPARLVEEKFRFDAAEFARHIAYKQVELDNGAVLTAPADKFEECFKETKRKDERTFTTTGQVVGRLKKTK